MKISIQRIDIDEAFVDPALQVRLTVEYYYQLEMPLSISGKLIVGNKTIAVISETSLGSLNPEVIRLMDTSERIRILNNENRPSSISIDLTVFLSPKAIDHIEKVRSSYVDQKVDFSFEFKARHLEIPEGTDIKAVYSTHIQLRIVPKEYKIHYGISQSDWTYRYAKGLGIGNFILLEFAIPEKQEVKADWEELYDRLYERTQDMELSIKKGEGKQVMFDARRFYENIKIGDGIENHKSFAESLKELFLEDNHDEVGYTHFLQGIYEFFEFSTKYIHDKTRKKELRKIPNYTKEDAYFIYTMSLGLLNLFAKKISLKNEFNDSEEAAR